MSQPAPWICSDCTMMGFKLLCGNSAKGIGPNGGAHPMRCRVDIE